jgi:hypothetical protein
MGTMEKVVVEDGHCFEVDVDACEDFGFEHGERVRVGGSHQGVVVGVAPLPEGNPSHCVGKKEKVLWVRLDGGENVIYVVDPSTNLQIGQ